MRIWLAASALLLASCGSSREKEPVSQYRNPPPAEAFSAFGRFEMKPVEISTRYHGPAPTYDAVPRVQQELDERIRPLLQEWTLLANRTTSLRTLVLEPSIERLNYVKTHTRILTGPYYGDAEIAMRVRYVDAATGKLIAEPRFFQDTGKWYAWVTVGVQDRAMLRRMAGLIAEYNTANYARPIGGRTGPDDAPLRPDELPAKN